MDRTGIAPLLLLLAFVPACGSRDDANARGAALFAGQACATCHGPEGTGTPFGPSLQGKQRYWTREKLAAYLRDPVAYASGDARLADQARKYTLPMQRFDKLPPEDLEAVAQFVLALP